MMIRNKRPNVPTSPCQSSNQCTILYHMFSIVMIWQNIFAGICSSCGAAFGFDPHDSRSPLSKHLKLFLQQRTAKPCWVSSSEYPEKNVPFPFFVSSVRSSSGYHGLIEIRSRPLFQIFQILQIRKWKWKWKDPTCAIFLKSMGFKDIEYDIPVYQM